MTLLTAIQRDPTTNSYIFKLYTIVNVLITIILSCEKKECKKPRWLDFKILSRLTFPAAVGHLPRRQEWKTNPSLSISCAPRSSLIMQAILLGEAACLLYTGLGCARMPKNMLSDAPTVPHCPLDGKDAPHPHEVSEIELPQEEGTLSAAPSRRGSFDYRCPSVITQPAGSAPTESANVVHWNVPACHTCHAPISGALYMAFDRAYCGAAACHKATARHCRPEGYIL